MGRNFGSEEFRKKWVFRVFKEIVVACPIPKILKEQRKHGDQELFCYSLIFSLWIYQVVVDKDQKGRLICRANPMYLSMQTE